MENDHVAMHCNVSGNSRDYFQRLINTINSLSRNEVETFVSIVLTTIQQDKNIFVIGNGGSAATATHFVTDIGIGLLRAGFRARAVSLCDNTAVVSAIGNDTHFRQIFSSQLQANGRAGDLLLIISASGNSENLLEAIALAKREKLQTFALVGFDGGAIKRLVDACVHVNTANGEYGIVEDIHLSLVHLLKEELLRTRL